LDKRLAYAARLKGWSCQAARASSGLRWPFFKARGLTVKPTEPGNYVTGTLVGAANLGSGKFAMIDDGLGFSLVPWQPVLEQRLRRQVTGVTMPGGGIDWTFGRSRGLGL